MQLCEAAVEDAWVEQGMYLLFWGKLSVTASRVHHFPPQSNYSRFHLATPLCPPQCTMMVTYDALRFWDQELKLGQTAALYVAGSHSAASNKIRESRVGSFAFQFLQNFQHACFYIKFSGMNHYAATKKPTSLNSDWPITA